MFMEAWAIFPNSWIKWESLRWPTVYDWMNDRADDDTPCIWHNAKRGEAQPGHATNETQKPKETKSNTKYRAC